MLDIVFLLGGDLVSVGICKERCLDIVFLLGGDLCEREVCLILCFS